MKKIISFVHISLDGFVAGPNGEMDWIKINEEIFAHVSTRICEGDTSMYGRKTYQLMESYWPTIADKPTATRLDIEYSKWYNKMHKIILSTTMEQEGLTNTTIMSGNLAESINKIKQSGHGGSKEILLFGSPTATHSLIQLDLIDGYWLFVNPVILGKGIPLFTGAIDKTNLTLLPATRQFECGVTELNYAVER